MIVTSVISATQTMDLQEEIMMGRVDQHAKSLNRLLPLPIRVLTMTVTASTSLIKADSSDIKEFFESAKIPAADKFGIIVRPKKISKRSRRTRRTFQNSIALQYIGINRAKCIKIFKNARVHITGILGGQDLLRTLQATSGSLAAMTSFDVDIVNYDINMINLQFYAGVKLDLPEIKSTIDDYMSRDPLISSVAYDSDRSPGLILKRKRIDVTETSMPEVDSVQPGSATEAAKKKGPKVKVSTLMMYRNGCIKICGLKNLVEAIDPYVFITSWLDCHPECILQE